MKATLTAVMLAVLVAAAGEIRINSLDVEADRAVSVTGPQSNQLARAAAAAGYAYSPTNPPPAAGNVVSVNAQTGVVVITAEDLGAVRYDITVTTNGPAWFLSTEGLSYGDGLALDAGTYKTTIPQYLQTGVYRIDGRTWDQFWVTNYSGEYVDIVFAPRGNVIEYYPQYYTRTSEYVPSATLEPLSGDQPQGTATLTFTEIVTVTTNFYATGAAVAASVAPKLDRSGGTATNLSVSGTLTASTIRDATSAGGSIQNAAGQPCITWGAGNGQGVTFANGVNVSGSLAVSGAATLTNTAVNGSFTLNGDNIASRTNEWRRIPWGALDAIYLISAHQTIRSMGASGASVSGVSVCESLCLYRADFVNNSSSTNIAVIAQRANYAGALTGVAQTNVITVSGAYVSLTFALPAAESSEYDFVRIRYENAGGGTLSTFLYFRALYERRATASEVTAYAAGWRPM